MIEPPIARTQDGDSAGALIRAAREKQGLHIAALAAAIKVSPRKLDALENDRWHELPDATFTRALAQTVCRTLKIDPRPVLQRLPPADSSGLEQVSGSLNAPFQDRQGRTSSGLSSAAIRPMVWASGLLAVAAVVVYFLPAGWLGDAVVLPSVADTATTVLPPLTAPSSSLPASAAASAVPAVSDATGSAAPLPGSALGAAAGDAGSNLAAGGAAPPAFLSASPSAGPAGETVFSAPSRTEALTAAEASPAVAAVPPAGLVQLRATETSWVEARDAGGQLLLSRTVQPGESVGLNGALPMRLVIGNASATELGFRGRPVDLAPLTRDNVARVELQ